MVDGKNFFDQPMENNKVTMKISEKMLLCKEMNIQQGVYQTILTLKIITK